MPGNALKLSGKVWEFFYLTCENPDKCKWCGAAFVQSTDVGNNLTSTKLALS